MWILVEKMGVHLSPDLLQGLDLRVHHGQLQAWRLWTFGVVRMSWKCGKLQSHLGEDKVYCRIWCQHGRCWLGLLHYELQTFLSTAILRIGELLMFAFCILNKRFFFSCVRLVHISAFPFFSFFFTFIFCFLGKRKNKQTKKKSKQHFLCSTLYFENYEQLIYFRKWGNVFMSKTAGIGVGGGCQRNVCVMAYHLFN